MSLRSRVQKQLGVTKYCPRCRKEYSPIDEIGRLNCSFHPDEYDEDTGFKCCGKKFGVCKPIVYADGFGAGYSAEIPVPKGCKNCDHGSYLTQFDLAEHPLFAQYLLENDLQNHIVLIGDGYNVQRYIDLDP